ncbi:probable E3 ubiquitin-protein ligase ATL45 [Ananas comosus]|uniref:RING-type E3 ubiquitin transferase n=1 Tax=Ananas comosus TaxID=4615 RepID=A0A6P5G9T4_ANACO|nr:probable E3 ubiquitin-protein ligase ATL45 [Ananas comosus]
MDHHRGDRDHRANPKYVAPVLITFLCFMSVGIVLALCRCLLATCSSSSAAQLIPAAAVPYEKSRGGEGEGEGDGTCAVCLADFEEGEAVRVLPECAHCFHVACIDAWLRARTSCPVCRAEIAPPPLRACHVARGDSLPHRMPPPAAIL